MKDVFVRKDRVPCDAVEESLKHTLPSGNHCRVFLCLCLLDGVIADGLLGRYWRNNKSRVELDEVVA